MKKTSFTFCEGRKQEMSDKIGGFHAISGDTNNNGVQNEQMLVYKQSELMSDLLFTVHQHGGDDVT